MCGIAGLININSEKIDIEDLYSFNNELAHRGPDSSGIYFDDSIGLSHTRLSIIDLSDDGSQPMSNENGSIWIVFNGEIYNYEELRSNLLSNGHIFKSNSDTEVIIHLYEEYGLSCLKMLRGMFAFALWDKNINQLLLVRDRIGKKPLYYTCQNNCFVFASEIKAIKSLKWIHCDFDPSILSSVFAYDHVPWPATMYTNIFKMPPATYMLVSKNSVSDPVNYWNMSFEVDNDITYQDAVYKLRSLLLESVKLRLRSDVPLGMFLSGGLDSSYIVGLSSKFVNKINTFSIGYSKNEFKDPEFKFSTEVANYFGTNHHQLIFDPNIIYEIEKIIKYYDEPFCIPNALAHYQLCRETKNVVTVALAGDGADEVFAGYDVYKKLRIVDKLCLSSSYSNSRCNYLHNYLPKNKILFSVLLACTPRPFRRGAIKQFAFHNSTMDFFSADLKNVFSNIHVGKLLDDFYLYHFSSDFINSVLYSDLMLNYSWSTTIATDVSGMSNSLEVRSPYLDHKVVEFAFSLPSSFKIDKNFREKSILYSCASDILPASIINRKKMSYGAGIPYHDFFYSTWHSYIKEIIFDEKVKQFNFFDYNIIENCMSGTNYYHNFRNLWRIFCTSVWIQNNI